MVMAHARSHLDQPRRADGKFGEMARHEDDGVDLVGGAEDTLSRVELARAWSLTPSLLQMEDPAERVGLPGGYVARIEADGQDPGDGIIEVGHYHALQHDTEGNETGAVMIHAFGSLPERSAAAQQIADATVRADRATHGAPTPEYIASLRAQVEAEAASTEAAKAEAPDPWNDEQTTSTTESPARRVVDDPDSFWHGAEIISTYTRADALADGTLVDHSTLAREAGFVWPVAVTAAAQNDCISWPETNIAAQDEEGRAWDVISCAKAAVTEHARTIARGGVADTSVGTRIPFSVHRVPNTARATVPQRTRLDVVISSDDDGSPCLTIMRPDED